MLGIYTNFWIMIQANYLEFVSKLKIFSPNRG